MASADSLVLFLCTAEMKDSCACPAIAGISSSMRCLSSAPLFLFAWMLIKPPISHCSFWLCSHLWLWKPCARFYLICSETSRSAVWVERPHCTAGENGGRHSRRRHTTLRPRGGAASPKAWLPSQGEGLGFLQVREIRLG